jgi:hypothetical protein
MTENESTPQSPSLVHPGTEPDHRKVDRDGRGIAVKWNLGDPGEDGQQRQARLHVGYQKSCGYRALVTTVLTSYTLGAVSEYYPVSLMKLDEVVVISATRFSQKGLERAITEALTVLQNRVDRGDPDIVRHFDLAGPTPAE